MYIIYRLLTKAKEIYSNEQLKNENNNKNLNFIFEEQNKYYLIPDVPKRDHARIAQAINYV